jgi:hypothetical protein
MNRLLSFFLLAVLSSNGVNGACPLPDVRQKFLLAADDEDVATALVGSLKSCTDKSGIITAYLGATEALMGKHAFMPTSKYSWCKKAMADFENAVSKDPENLEIRYLRLAVESNLPSFLNMSQHIQQDKVKSLQLLKSSADKELNRKVATLLLDRKICTKSEESQLQQHIQ